MPSIGILTSSIDGGCGSANHYKQCTIGALAHPIEATLEGRRNLSC